MVRDLINQEKASKDPLYCVRVTSDDGEIGNQHLRTFQDNEKTIPTILTTSQKLSTGVDARNVRNIVLMRPVNSMIEFKQIIGRGTRLYEGKDYFTIHDFVNAHERFHDKDWDGEPIEPEPATPRPPKLPPEPTPPADPTDDDADDTPRRPVVRITLADGSVRKLRGIAVTSFWSPDGIPMSAKDFIERMFGELPELFKDEDELRALWGHPETRRRLLEALGERGYGAEQLEAIWRLIDAPASDVFDVLAYIAFARDPITREARVGGKRGDILATYDDKLAEFIGFVLGEYVRDGYDQLDDSKLADLLTLKFGGLQPARSAIGDMATIRKAFIGFQSQLYAG
jgi:type I restriction enzyme R subunit